MLQTIMRLMHLDAIQGKGEERSKAYIWYAERAPKLFDAVGRQKQLRRSVLCTLAGSCYA